MIKSAPSPFRIAAMVAFTLSCFGLVMFLWIAFGGSLPLRPESYRFTVAIPEAATLAPEADVRLAGVNVGKVKRKELDKGGRRTLVEIELEERYAPIPDDSRVMLRQKTLLGETYVELAPGPAGGDMLADGGRLRNTRVERTVELDEIFSAFDERTRSAFRRWVRELRAAMARGGGQDLNDALGNLPGFAGDGSKLLDALDEQEIAVRHLVRNTGRVFGAINEREGALRELIVNSNDTFEATASRDEALAETFAIFPTFLDESRTTLARLERFARRTRPLVAELRGPARDLGPTVRDLGLLAPHLRRLFRDLPPLISASRRGLPALERTLRGAEPLVEALHPFFRELNPILSYLNFHQATVAGFLSNAGVNLAAAPAGDRIQVQILTVDGKSFQKFTKRPDHERGNAYPAPNAHGRAHTFGTFESFDCDPAGGPRRDPEDAEEAPAPTKNSLKRLPCFVQPPSLYSGKQFDKLEAGVAPNRPAPKEFEGTAPAGPPR